MHSSIQRDGHDKCHDSKFTKKAIEAQHVQNRMERKEEAGDLCSRKPLAASGTQSIATSAYNTQHQKIKISLQIWT